uniref:Uncharacterized protein n=1 Tax=Clytia hemisphaerica TaxID=252671 RepID=A0A7M5WSL9_9CNID
MSNSEELPVQRRRRRRLHMREERRSYNTRTENNTNTENHRRRLTESSSEDEQKERPRPIPPRRRRKAIRIMRRTVIVSKSPMRISNEIQVRDEKKRPEERKKKTVSSSLLSQENGFLKFNEEQIKLFRQNRTQQRKLDHVTLKLKKNLGKTIEQLEQANENLLDIFQRAEWKITQYEFEMTTKSPLRWYQVNKKKKEKSNMVEYKRLIDLKVEAVRLSDVIVSEIRLLKEQNRSLSNKKS